MCDIIFIENQKRGKLMKKIYVAAPLFTNEEKIFNKKVQNWLKHKFHTDYVFLPQDYVSPKIDKHNTIWARDVFDHDTNAIYDADMICIVDNGDYHSDDGSAFEVGYAYAMNKEIIFISDSPELKKSLMIGNAVNQFYIYDEENDTFWQRDRDCFYWT